MAQPAVQLARVYEEVRPDEGRRVLVDRLWPRGMKKSDPRVGVWMRAVAPSNELRAWYGHDGNLFDDFRALYLEELKDPERAAALVELMELASAGPVTVTTATREIEISHAAVIASLIG